LKELKQKFSSKEDTSELRKSEKSSLEKIQRGRGIKDTPVVLAKKEKGIS